MKNIYTKLLWLFVIVISYNCGSDDETEPIPDGTTDPVTPPDTNPNPNKTTTYIADVKVIIDTECIRCHTDPPANGAPFSLRNYKDIMDAINVGKQDIAGAMNEPGRNVMPPEPEGRLPQETIDVVLDWKADGYLEQ